MAGSASDDVVPNYEIGRIIGFANDGIAGCREFCALGEDGKVDVGGSLDAGSPLSGKVRQAKFPLSKGTKWG
jgi:hypothetical protein